MLKMEKWGLIDDCAHWLQPGNIETGRIEMKSRIEAFQGYCENRYASWQKAKVATLCLYLASLSYVAYRAASHGVAQSEFGISWASFAFAATALTWNFPSILQQLPTSWNHLRVFDNESLQPLRDYLRHLANSDRRISTSTGEVVNREIFNTDWALLYLTSATELNSLPRLVSSGIWMKHYHGEFLVEKPPALIAISEPKDTEQVHIHFNQQLISIKLSQLMDVTEVHNHFEFVTRVREQAMSKAPPNTETLEPEVTSPKGGKRWPCRFENDDYEIRLLIFRTKVLPKLDKVKPHHYQKYVAAIDGARKHWLEDPTIGVQDLAEKLGPLVAKSSNTFAGLNESQSVSWIRSLIGGYGKYGFVREAFEAIQYDPEQYQDVQYRLLSE
jgi:hypothetical protein